MSAHGLTTVERARGRWREILPQRGIAPRFLVNTHGPCPLCGGKDRFRFDDKNGDGTYFCNQCGAGTGIIMLRKLHGWDHATACAEVDRIIGTAARRAPTATACADASAARKRQALERVMAEATAPEIVARYLRHRGLAVSSGVLQGHRSLWHAKTEQRLPAVVAPILGPDGRLQSVHRIYLDPATGKKAAIEPKMTMPAIETINGGAVRLFGPDEDLAICEGIETALAVNELYNLPAWAALTANGIETFQPPAKLRRLVIFGDNDQNYVGQAAAYALAKRLKRDRTKLDIDVELPPDPGDWLDVLNRVGAA